MSDAQPPIDATIATLADANPLIDAAPGSADASVRDAAQVDATPTGVDASSPLNTGIRIVEVYYNHTSGDDNFEWVKLYNGTANTIDLGDYALGWGGPDYTYGLMDLAGTVAAYTCFVVGGPSGNAASGSPSFDLANDFNPDMQNSGTAGDGVALFNLGAFQVTATTTPLHAVIYGPNNNNGLYDENGANGNVDVADGPDESSARMKADLTWERNTAPSPNACLPFP